MYQFTSIFSDVIDVSVHRMVADLMKASFPGQLPIIPNPPLTYNITHGIPSFWYIEKSQETSRY